MIDPQGGGHGDASRLFSHETTVATNALIDKISGYQDFEDAAAMLTVAVNSEASPDARRELLSACWWLRDAVAKIEGSVR